MIQPGQSNTQAVRAVFIIDPDSKIRTILIILCPQEEILMRSNVLFWSQKADRDNVQHLPTGDPG